MVIMSSRSGLSRSHSLIAEALSSPRGYFFQSLANISGSCFGTLLTRFGLSGTRSPPWGDIGGLVFKLLLKSLFICVGFSVNGKSVDGETVDGFPDNGGGSSRIQYSLRLNVPDALCV